MFFCESCRVKRDWPTSLFRSVGNCELCEERADCYEVASSNLPKTTSQVLDAEGYVVETKQ